MSAGRRVRMRETIRKALGVDPTPTVTIECVESPDGRHCNHWHEGDYAGCCWCGSDARDEVPSPS